MYIRTGTYTRGGTEIQQDLALLEEAIFLVELDQLEGGTGAVSLLLCELVPLVETTLSVLLLDRHGGQSSRVEAEGCAGMWLWSSGDSGCGGVQVQRCTGLELGPSRERRNATDYREIENFFS